MASFIQSEFIKPAVSAAAGALYAHRRELQGGGLHGFPIILPGSDKAAITLEAWQLGALVGGAGSFVAETAYNIFGGLQPKGNKTGHLPSFAFHVAASGAGAYLLAYVANRESGGAWGKGTAMELLEIGAVAEIASLLLVEMGFMGEVLNTFSTVL